MASIATITVNDGQTTPVARNFTPVNVIGGVATFEERSSGIPIAFQKATISYKRASKAARNDRAYLKVELPVTATVDGDTVRVRTPLFEINCVIPVSSTPEERKDLAAYVKNFTASTVFQNMIANGDAIYG